MSSTIEPPREPSVGEFWHQAGVIQFVLVCESQLQIDELHALFSVRDAPMDLPCSDGVVRAASYSRSIYLPELAFPKPVTFIWTVPGVAFVSRLA